MTHTSSLVYWSFRMFYRAPSTCFEPQHKHRYRWNRYCTETERLCYTAEGIGLRRGWRGIGSETIVTLGSLEQILHGDRTALLYR